MKISKRLFLPQGFTLADIIGILTFIRMINTPSESKKSLKFQYFSFNEQLNFHAVKAENFQNPEL